MTRITVIQFADVSRRRRGLPLPNAIALAENAAGAPLRPATLASQRHYQSLTLSGTERRGGLSDKDKVWLLL
jgi:hypothetical protein